MLRCLFLIISLLCITVYEVNAGCTYTEINSDLNTCIRAATTSTTVRWFFPHGTIGEQAEICQASAQTTLTSCINDIFHACRLDAKSTKMFGIRGGNLVTAYTNLCASSLLIEAQACMSVVTDTVSFTTAETNFKTAVTALPDSASKVEICGLATTMKYTAFTTLLTPTCMTSQHRAVWAEFYDTILNTNVCTCGVPGLFSSHVIFMLVASWFVAWSVKFEF